MGKFEEKYNHTLRSIEIAVVRQYRQFDNLHDWQIRSAVNGLIRTYASERRHRPPPKLKLDASSLRVYDNLKDTCDGWLGQAPLIDEAGSVTTLAENALTLEEMIACLKRIRRSINMWEQEGGQRGYFNFIDQFLP